jgi:hypothetical protein
VDEADERFIERLWGDLAPLTDPRAALASVRIDRETTPGTVRIVLGLVGPAGDTEVIGEGSTLLEAAARLPMAIAEARVAAAFDEVLERAQA